ncbi:YybH family protein [Kordia sp.]|uniref:YybH family protein n=1 Tax=Kordia sp. TaxID=1965332 RepID=UPI003D6B05BA
MSTLVFIKKNEKMKLKTLLLTCIILLSIGCKQQANKEKNVTNSKTKKVQSEKISDYSINWVEAINNNNIPAIEKMYASNAVKVISADNILETSSQIANYYGIKKNTITEIESLFKIEASKNKHINYELIKYKTEDQKEYIQIVIWKLENRQVIREFEFTEKRSLEAKKVDINEIADRRKLWIKLCNANNAENLVKQLYSDSTIYFNHKPIVKGIKDLIKEYNYMNNDKYSLHLQPIKLEVVNANFAYEIGQCSGSYKGKYILVWKKQSDGNWKIYIDSNI